MRDAGQHPPRVWVLAGDDWSRGPFGAGYVLALRSGDEPSRIDWRVLVGLPTHVVARGHAGALQVACLAARVTAPVVLHNDAGGLWSSMFADGGALRQGDGLDAPLPQVGRAMSADLSLMFPLWPPARQPLADWSREDEQGYLARRWDWLLARTAVELREPSPALSRQVSTVVREREQERRA